MRQKWRVCAAITASPTGWAQRCASGIRWLRRTKCGRHEVNLSRSASDADVNVRKIGAAPPPEAHPEPVIVNRREIADDAQRQRMGADSIRDGSPQEPKTPADLAR